MASESHTVSLSTAGATFEQTITFVNGDFLPKMARAWSTSQGSMNSLAGSAMQSVGFWAADPDGDQQGCVFARVNDGGSSANSFAHRSDCIVENYGISSTTPAQRVSIKSVQAGSCTLECTITDNASRDFNIVFNDCEDACVVHLAQRTSAGTTNYTDDDLDFNPDGFFLCGTQRTTVGASLTDARMYSGFASSTTKTDSHGFGWAGNDGANGVGCFHGDNHCLAHCGHSSDKLNEAFWTTGGGTNELAIDFDTADASAWLFMVLAFKADNIATGSFTSTTSTSVDQTISGVGFETDSVDYMTAGQTAVDTISATNLFNLWGCGSNESSDTNRAMWVNGKYSSPGADRYQDSADCIIKRGNIGTLQTEGRNTNYGDDGWDIDFSTAVATTLYAYIAIQHTPVAGVAKHIMTLTGAGIVPA